jgi:hypothetical protein
MNVGIVSSACADSELGTRLNGLVAFRFGDCDRLIAI